MVSNNILVMTLLDNEKAQRASGEMKKNCQIMIKCIKT